MQDLLPREATLPGSSFSLTQFWATACMSHVQDLLDSLGDTPPGYEWDFGTGEDDFEDVPRAFQQDTDLEDTEDFKDEAAFAQGSPLWADLRESIMPSSDDSGPRAFTHIEALREQGELFRMMQVRWWACQSAGQLPASGQQPNPPASRHCPATPLVWATGRLCCCTRHAPAPAIHHAPHHH